MKKPIDILNNILLKYKFTESVPLSIQQQIGTYSMKALKGTLQKFGEYSFFYGVTIKVLIAFRKFGLRISIIQMKVILVIVSGVITAGIVFSTYAIINNNQLDNKQNETTIKESNESKKLAKLIENKKDTIKKKLLGDRNHKELLTIKNSVGVSIFKSAALSKEKLVYISHMFSAELLKLLGDKQVVLTMQRNRKAVEFLLLGSVEKLGDTFIMQSKIVHVKQSKIVVSLSDSFDSWELVHSSIKKLALKLAKKIKNKK